MTDMALDYPGLVIDADRIVWDGRFKLREVRFRHRQFDGTQSRTYTWELAQRGRAAAVLPYDPASDSVVLIEQFRLPALAAGIDPVLIEIPAGLCDPGEEPGETAVRETHEETGLIVGHLEPMGSFILSPGASDETVALYCARITAPVAAADGIAGHGGLRGEEDIRIRVWPATRAIDAVLGGQIANAPAAIALLWLAARRDWLRARWSGPASP